MNCKVCQSGRTHKYFELRNSPGLQNVLYSSAEAAGNATAVSAEFWICERCLALFNPQFLECEYSTEYNNDQSHSAAYRAHLADVASLLRKYLTAGNRIVEIGCGNGLMLKLLFESGLHGVVGYDPAHAKGLPFVRSEYWRPTGGLCDALILRHTLEAVAGFRELLTNAVAELRPEGILYLELTNARFIVERAATVTLYHEYPQYFSETAAALLLDELGLYIHDIQHFGAGEILGIVARRKLPRMPRSPRLDKLSAFQNVCIWGVSGRTIHFLTNYGIGTSSIRYGVDIDPKKQGRYIPRTGQRIITPQECIASRPDAVVVLNERYVSEVAQLFPYEVSILTDRDFYNE